MKKPIHLLLATLLIAAVAFTGCQAISDFKEEHPVAFDVIKGTAKALLLSQVPSITDDTGGQLALNTVINTAFANAEQPEAVAAALAQGVAEIYPDDTSLQHMIAAEWATALRAPDNSTAPASVPGARAYQLQLADALQPPVAASPVPRERMDY